jgi:hypothetical protein
VAAQVNRISQWNPVLSVFNSHDMDAVAEKEYVLSSHHAPILTDNRKIRHASDASRSGLSVSGVLDTAANVYNGVRITHAASAV